MHTLVTGGAGFIGSHTCERLVAAGERVTALDDLSTGSAANVAELEGSGRFRLVEGAVTDAALVEELVAEADAVVHLAAVVGVRLVLEEPLRTLETNVLGTSVVLRAAARRRIAVLVASSSEVYGPAAIPPLAEDDPVHLGPAHETRWTYARSKATAEALAFAHVRVHGLPVVVVRLFNTVGPRQSGRYGMVLPRFAAQALAGAPITVYGDGRQTRSFLHVRDAVEACRRLLATPAAHGRVVNVGSEEEVAIGDLAAMVRAAAGSRSPIVHLPHREAYGVDFVDFPRRRPATARLAALTGFRATVPLAAIVREAVARRAAEVPALVS
ncbi:MAG: SDR family NAD(P)-dependent oxidoreductase [Planctomycetota bacterium]